jgi:phosphate uptake regulator/thiamine kinase-like enzyme
MRIPSGIRQNLRFLIIEVESQISNLKIYFDTRSITIAKRILDRSGYTNNLKSSIHNSCLGLIIQNKEGSADTSLLRSLEIIATDLDRIVELCRDCIQQVGYLDDTRQLPSDLYISLLGRVIKGIKMIETAIDNGDTQQALKIGRIEDGLDNVYKKQLKKHIHNLQKKKKKHTGDLVAVLFVAHSIEQMGDVLLSISEAIISANLGLSFDRDRYHSLQASIEQLDGDLSTKDKRGNEQLIIFKDGHKQKVKEEREGVESWHDVYPGLAPKILSYHKRGKTASLLIEHLSGLTFEQILLHEQPKLNRQSMKQLQKTLRSVWRETRTKTPVFANYMGQLQKRLDDVYKLHPEFRQSDSQICGKEVPSFDVLLRKARRYERDIRAPFSVYIHGDFNVDNIIYDPVEKKINFIDLHRSTYMDYVQDISVFMVSNYRLHVLDKELRRRILSQGCSMYDFSASYAHKIGDSTFNLRLALGLARSFATSTRFVLDKKLARAMWLRARYLIELVLATNPKQAGKFRVPVQEVFNV